MLVTGEKCIVGLEGADFGDYIMDGMMTAERRYVPHLSVILGPVTVGFFFLLCEYFVHAVSWHHRVQKCKRLRMESSRARLSSRSGAGQPRALGQLQPRASGTSLASGGQAGPLANYLLA